MRHFWRFVSPSTLLFALLLFPLPWVEIQCPEGRRGNGNVPGTSIAMPKWTENIFGQRREVFFTQSGWQAVHGQFTRLPSASGDLKEEAQRERLAGQLAAAMPAVPALLLFPTFLLIGFLAGVALPLGPARRLALAVAATGAVGVAVSHYLGELPLKQAYRQVALQEGALKSPPAALGEIEDEVQGLTRATGCFWLAQGALLSSLGFLLAEWAWQRRQRPRAPAQALVEEMLVNV